MAFQSKQIFVNLPVKDMNKSIAFFTALGFAFNPQFTDEKATCMIIGEGIYAMLLVESFFKTFTEKEIANTATTTEVILALAAESREQVDEFVQKALDHGGKPYNDKVDHGFMYTWSFQDVDGHLWEIMYMDESAVPSE
jgi:uncharacterized protein